MAGPLLAFLAALAAPSARGFTIATGFTDGCHETMTLRAYVDFVLPAGLPAVYVPDSPDHDAWRQIAAFFADEFITLDPHSQALADALLGSEPNDDVGRFLLTSLLIGVRSPDTEGHSALNLFELRDVHADPDPRRQYAHALRGPADDFEGGGEIAVEGTRVLIGERVRQAIAGLEATGRDQIVMTPTYIEFYGQVDVPVNAAMFYLGQAAHAVQDSFAHDVRDEASGYREILGVLNFVEAVGGEHDEARDGLAHSESMDDCMGPPGQPGGTVEAAVAATVDLFIAFRAEHLGLDPDAMDGYLARWFRFRGGCTVDNGFCGNERWITVLREKQSKPFLESLFSCAASPRPAPRRGTALLLASSLTLLLLVGRAAARRRR